jgi:hypothetical protein
VRLNSTIVVLGLVLILSLALIGCSCQGPSVPQPAPTPTPSTSSPLATPASASPLPTPAPAKSEPEPELPLVYPTSQPGFATVTGTLLRRGTGKGVQGYSLYLGEVIPTSDPEQFVVGLDKAVAPRAILAATGGAYAFYDVPPGRYALEIDIPLGVPVLVNDPEEGGTLFLTIEGGENIDLGTLYVEVPAPPKLD